MSLISKLHNKYCNRKVGGVYNWENKKILGQGQFGVVYQIDQDFIIKKFKYQNAWETEKNAIERIRTIMLPVLEYTLLEESKAIDPHSDEGSGEFLIRYPNSQGFTLTEYLSKLRKLNFNTYNVNTKIKLYTNCFLKVATSVLNVIKHLTKNNYVHCDIKPDNLMFSERTHTPNIRVIDFAGVTSFDGPPKCQMKTGMYTRNGMLNLVGVYPLTFGEFLQKQYNFEEVVVQKLIPKLKRKYNDLFYNIKKDIDVPLNVDDLFASGLVLCLFCVKEMEIKYLDFAIRLLNLDPEKPYTIDDAIQDFEQLKL